MKKLISLLLAGVLTLGFAGCGSQGGGTGASGSSEGGTASSGSNVVKVYNWGEYIGEDVIQNFEKEYNAKVIYEYFDSNEMMYTKLLAGDSYDVLVPSDYMIERLIKEDRLQPIDLDKIPNFENLADSLKGLDYDPDNTYSVPYFWGNVGLVYNKNSVPKEEIEAKGYEILRDEKYKGRIYIYDSERDAFMTAFKALGYSMNTDNEDEINAAYEWLCDINNKMEPAYVTDEVIDSMANGNKDIAVVYSGDAAYILQENEDMGFCMPKEGTNLWSDAMVIPKNAENPELAHEFINYILSYDASMDNSVTVGYASSNKDVLKDLSGEDGEFYGNEAYLPREDYDKDEIFHDNEVLKKRLSELWIKVKAGN
ncbi:MAG: ABC transporter substrate-binding protein [Firmicutes bacterium]|nr:ABC transporter substrate-binding protein [Bacillota bacterium]